MALKKVKAQRITWTTAWRRMNKKIKTDEHLRKKKRRNVKVNKAIIGISLDDIKKRKTEKPEVRKAQQEQALRDIKERKAKDAEKRRVQAKVLNVQSKKQNVAKNVAQKKDKGAKGKR